MWLVNLFLLFNPRVSTTTVGRELTKDCHEWNGPVFGQTSITSRLEYFASRSYKSSSLVKPETEQRSKLIISKANLISLYSLFPHLCCLADKRLFSLLSFFFFYSSLLPFFVFFNDRKYSKVRTGSNTVEIRLNLLCHALGRVSGE